MPRSLLWFSSCFILHSPVPSLLIFFSFLSLPLSLPPRLPSFLNKGQKLQVAESGPRGKSDANWLLFLRTLPCIKVLTICSEELGSAATCQALKRCPIHCRNGKVEQVTDLFPTNPFGLLLENGHCEPQVRGEWEQQGAVRAHQASVRGSFKIIMKDYRQKNINLLPPGWVNRPVKSSF